MSKKNVQANLPAGTPMEGRVIYDYQIRDLEGRLLTFVESLGLRESQEKSAKDIFRDIFYSVLYQQTLRVSGEMLGPTVTATYKETTDMGMSPNYSRINGPAI